MPKVVFSIGLQIEGEPRKDAQSTDLSQQIADLNKLLEEQNKLLQAQGKMNTCLAWVSIIVTTAGIVIPIVLHALGY